MALPAHPQELCFPTDVFLGEDFHVDEFVSHCRQRVTIERLREDLEAYFRTLKSAMVELINKDYADFVSLSSNLVGMDKAIGNIMAPLGKLREDVTGIKTAMDAAINATERKLALREDIRQKKITLQRLIAILESVEKLERLLKITRSPVGSEASEIEQLEETEEFASVVMERIASEFNKLQYNVSHTSDHPLVEEVKPRIASITATLQSSLEHSFRVGLEGGGRHVLARCLQTYTSIGRQQAAETMFQNLIVHPYMDKVISTKAVLTHPQGLSGMYNEVLKFVPRHCSLLLELTTPSHRQTGVGVGPGIEEHDPRLNIGGFDFVVNAVWPEIVALLDEKTSLIFAPGNPDSFHKNYTATMDFVSAFEALCPSQSSVKCLRVHSSFIAFMSKWSLPVYFQIRFQEIAGALEGSLSIPLTVAKPSERHNEAEEEGERGKDMKPHPALPPFQLELFHILWSCLQKCWEEGVFLPALVHKFWKLSLQLFSRLVSWLEELYATEIRQAAEAKASTESSEVATTLPVALCLCVIHDCEELASQIPVVYSLVIQPKLPSGALKSSEVLEESLEEARDQLLGVVPKYATLIVDQVSQLCMTNLEPAHTIPRLYRRTNRDAPQKPSSYVNNVLRPLKAMKTELPDQHQTEWSCRITEAVTERYFQITSEVLTSVKRTEDSLSKLKRNRKSLVPTTGGMSDDNKIRLQLALDIEQYISQVRALKLDDANISSLVPLEKMAGSARTTALSSPS